MGYEFELKYRATPLVQEKLLKTGEFQTVQMETTYYDTPSGSLSRRHYTLRRRLENGKSVCTLKTPAGPFGRGEWETESGSIQEALIELCKLGGPADLLSLTQEGLVPVCGARFTRQAAQVLYEGTALELALDRGILFAGEREEALCEIEVELKSGDPAAAQGYANLLAQGYGLEPEAKSKFKRALALIRPLNQTDSLLPV